MPGGDLHQGDRLFIVSPFNNNMVYANGQPVRRLNRGESLRQVLNDAQRITSDLPVYVFHLTGMGCELSGALAPWFGVRHCGVPPSFAQTTSN